MLDPGCGAATEVFGGDFRLRADEDSWGSSVVVLPSVVAVRIAASLYRKVAWIRSSSVGLAVEPRCCFGNLLGLEVYCTRPFVRFLVLWVHSRAAELGTAG